LPVLEGQLRHQPQLAVIKLLVGEEGLDEPAHYPLKGLLVPYLELAGELYVIAYLAR